MAALVLDISSVVFGSFGFFWQIKTQQAIPVTSAATYKLTESFLMIFIKDTRLLIKLVSPQAAQLGIPFNWKNSNAATP